MEQKGKDSVGADPADGKGSKDEVDHSPPTDQNPVKDLPRHRRPAFDAAESPRQGFDIYFSNADGDGIGADWPGPLHTQEAYEPGIEPSGWVPANRGLDNCPNVYNPDQTNSDNDQFSGDVDIGDACDLDQQVTRDIP